MVEVFEVHTPSQLQHCFEIRKAVFVAEQQVPADLEIDALDSAPTTVHLLAAADEKPVGTIRLLPAAPGQVHIGRVAVANLARGRGIGRLLMQRGHEIAVARFASAAGKVEIEISAQVQAVPFYKSLGYELRSCEVYLDAGIAHQDMYWRGEK